MGWGSENTLGMQSECLWVQATEASPSCCVLQELSKLGLGVDTDIELRTLQLPVDYREVKQRLTTIWEDFQPQVSDTWRGCGSGKLMMGPGPRNFLDLDLDLKAGVHLFPGPHQECESRASVIRFWVYV